jgi:hypothetical protein
LGVRDREQGLRLEGEMPVENVGHLLGSNLVELIERLEKPVD